MKPETQEEIIRLAYANPGPVRDALLPLVLGSINKFKHDLPDATGRNWTTGEHWWVEGEAIMFIFDGDWIRRMSEVKQEYQAVSNIVPIGYIISRSRTGKWQLQFDHYWNVSRDFKGRRKVSNLGISAKLETRYKKANKHAKELFSRFEFRKFRI